MEKKNRVIITIVVVIIIILIVVLCICELDRNRPRNIVPDKKMYYFGYNILASPFNWFLSKYTKTKKDLEPFPPMKSNFPGHNKLKSNWKLIRDEVMELYNREGMSTIKGDLFFDRIIPDGDKWKKFYIKWLGDTLPDAKLKLPLTCKLIDDDPSIKIAMISLLQPGAVILPHVGPLFTCMRYHLGLKTPTDKKNCYILVDGIKYSWSDGEDVLFDDTYVHEIRNDTDEMRVILFCDIQREYTTGFANGLSDLVCHYGKITTRNNFNGLKQILEF